jgi:hypothetical protein
MSAGRRHRPAEPVRGNLALKLVGALVEELELELGAAVRVHRDLLGSFADVLEFSREGAGAT